MEEEEKKSNCERVAKSFGLDNKRELRIKKNTGRKRHVEWERSKKLIVYFHTGIKHFLMVIYY